MGFSKIKLSNKLLLGFVSMLIIIIIVSVIYVSRLNQISSSLNTLVNFDNQKLTLAYDMRENINQIAIAVRNVSNSQDQTYRNIEKKLYDDSSNKYKQDEAKLNKLIPR